MPLPAQLTSQDSVSAVLNWSSSASIQNSANERLVIDSESREWRLMIEHALNERWSLRLQVPYRTISAGSLDDFLKHWHQTFGLPNGDRDALPRSKLQIRYARDGTTIVGRTTAASGLGDISLDTGYQWIRNERSNVSAWFSLKAPTGDADTLNGSGAMDAALTVAAERRLSDRWSTYGQVSLTHLGRSDLLADEQRRWTYSGNLGIDVRFWGNLSLGAQLDAHSAVVESSHLKMLGDAVALTFGGNYLTQSNWRFTLGITEDVMVDASPDVTFVFQIGKALRNL